MYVCLWMLARVLKRSRLKPIFKLTNFDKKLVKVSNGSGTEQLLSNCALNSCVLSGSKKRKKKP